MTETPTEPPEFDVVEFRRRQTVRARIMGVGLIGLVALFYFITIARVGIGQ